jgi:hypothetical protein
MEILVNKENIDFTLEQEQSIGEVVDGLAQWLESGELAITGLDLDDESYPIHDRTRWADISLTSVRTLSVEVLPMSEVDRVALEAVDEYCSLLVSCVRSGEAGALAQLVEELPYVRERIRSFFPELAAQESILEHEELNRGVIPEKTEELLEQISAIRSIIDTRLREYVDPDAELQRSIDGLIAATPALRDVPVDLQVGRTGEAMQNVVRFAELFSRILRVLPRTKHDAQLDRIKELIEGLTPYLTQVKDAIETEDSVLLGDLMEYEIAPRLESLSEPANQSEE